MLKCTEGTKRFAVLYAGQQQKPDLLSDVTVKLKREETMAKIITLTNQKGGVGKTTTCSALCGCLNKLKKRVLACDLDPQGNLSFSLGADTDSSYTIYDVFKGRADLYDTIQL